MTTVIVHGTFAMQRDWWRPGNPFPQAVGQGMADEGFVDDVWRVDGVPVSSIDALARKAKVRVLDGRERLPFETNSGCFHWSGTNSHTDRVKAGDQLANYLVELSRQGAGAIDVIAHSHGGNVVKEASQYFDGPVMRRVVFLGTPHFVNRDGSGVPYRLNPAAVAEAAVNLYSELDTVQVDAAQMAPDFAVPAGMPGIGSFAGGLDPVVAQRNDADSGASHLYQDVEVPVDAGRGKKAHSALCSGEIGYVIGRWLARSDRFVHVWNGN